MPAANVEPEAKAEAELIVELLFMPLTDVLYVVLNFFRIDLSSHSSSFTPLLTHAFTLNHTLKVPWASQKISMG